MARMLVIFLIAAVVGGGMVYGALLYLGQNPVEVNIQLLEAAPTPIPTLQPLSAPTLTTLPAATFPPTSTVLATAMLRPIATVTSAPTPTPTAAGSTEREMVVAAFAACNGKYSGEEISRRIAATNSAIDRELHSVASIRALVEQNCGGAFPPSDMAALPTSTLHPTPTRESAVATPPTSTPVPTISIQSIIPTSSPDQRHTEEKRYMLELINAERQRAGVGAVTLGDNIAAQLHAEAALKGCFSSHWGVDGLKPYMRYSLAGGYQSNGENGSGLGYCIRAADGYAANGAIQREIRETMDGWMRSPGHRRNLLDPHHKKVNIGIAWDRYNTVMYQHFEGDYVQYDKLPTIANGTLSLSGRTKNGVRLNEKRDLSIQIYYDSPPHTLTRGQVARTYCYDGGRPVASLRWPLSGRSRWTTDTFFQTYKPCPDPYDAPPDIAAPGSPTEAHQAWQEAYNASQGRASQSLTVPWITASEWMTKGTEFSVQADISEVLNRHGDGVYTLTVWGKIGGEEDLVISQYSIFHAVEPPDTYTQSQ